MKISIGCLNFNSKKEAYVHTQTIICLLGECVIDRTHSLFKFFIDLIEPNGQAYGKITHFSIAKHAGYGSSLHLHVSSDNHVETSVSWVECARRTFKKDTEKTMLVSAMRDSISNAVNEYRSSCYNTSKNMSCKICGTGKNLQVDHVEPFDTLFKFFTAHNKPPTTYHSNKYGKWVFNDIDVDYKNKWIDYHDKNTSFQILCNSCNSKKSNKTNYHTMYQRQEEPKKKRKEYLKKKRIEKLTNKLLSLTS
jgi:hypothetical protein